MKFLKFLLPLTIAVSLAACSPVGRQGATPPEQQPQAAAKNTRIIRVSSENWKFSPNVITVKKGEKVQLQVMGVSGTHGFAVPDLGINVPVAPGQTVMIDVPTDTVGAHNLFCSIPCGSGHKNMKGQIVIEE
jgi:heme/copper-type cytochrome/quinol oxidase subunit 2